MNRRKFLIGAAVFPVAISMPILVHEDPYDKFLRELRLRVIQELDGRKLERLWIDPGKNGRRLVHLFVGGREITWYQVAGYESTPAVYDPYARARFDKAYAQHRKRQHDYESKRRTHASTTTTG